MTTASAPALTELTGTYTLDPAHSRIGFVARHAMVTKVRGSFDEFAGTAVLDGANPANSRVEVTIDGATNEITIPFEFEGAAKDPFGNQRVGFEGSATINRRDYGVTWNAALEGGGVLVSDKVTLEFEISAIKNA
jgi:polyisoprenoid-binding protein YceI